MLDRRRARDASDHVPVRPRRPRLFAPLLLLALCLAAGLLALAVAAPAARAVSTTGDISGTVTDASHAGLAGIIVSAYRSDGSGGWTSVNDANTASDGSYDIGGLAAGTYRVAFTDYFYRYQCYDNMPDLGSATNVSVTVGQTRSGVNATLLAMWGWTPQSSHPSTAYLAAVAFPDASHGWAVGDTSGASSPVRGAVLATTDGGASWTAQSPGTPSFSFLHGVAFTDASHGWAVGGGSNGVIVATSDGGAHWTTQDAGTFADLKGVASTDASHGWAVGTNGTILATSDGGAHWNAQSSGTDQDLLGVHFVDVNHGWVVGAGGTILVTTDGGAHWAAQSSGTTGEFDGVDFVDASHGWAVGPGIFATSDGGAHWTLQSSSDSCYSVDFADASHGWVVGHWGMVLGTTDGGAHWTSQLGGTDEFSFLGVDSTDATHAWAVGGNSNDEGVVLSTATGGAPVASSAKRMTAFGFQGLSPVVTGTIDEGTHAIAATVPFGTNVSALVATFTTTGASVKVGSMTQVSGTTPNDFTSPVTYTVTAADDTTQRYVVTVTVVPVLTPTLTLTLSGLGSGSLKLGKSVTAGGAVTPTSLAGSRATLTVQLKNGAKWVQAKTFSVLISSTGTYSWKYKPAKKGAYRVQGSIARTATHAAATTKWLAFKVK